MSIIETEASFKTKRFEVFAIRCVREHCSPTDIYIAHENEYWDEPMPEPVCVVTVRDWARAGRSNRYDCRTIEYVYVPAELRRGGIATEMILGIQANVGALSDCDRHGFYKCKPWWPKDGQKFFDAIGHMLQGDVAGTVAPEDDDWGGCQAEQAGASGDDYEDGQAEQTWDSDH